MLNIYSKKLWEAEKRRHDPRRIQPGIFIIVHIFLGLKKSAIGDAMIQRDVKSIGIHLNNIHVYNLDAIKKLPLDMVLVKNIQVSIVLEHFIRLVMG